MTADAATGFNTRLWRRFVQIALPYWQSPERWRSRGLLALLMQFPFADCEGQRRLRGLTELFRTAHFTVRRLAWRRRMNCPAGWC